MSCMKVQTVCTVCARDVLFKSYNFFNDLHTLWSMVRGQCVGRLITAKIFNMNERTQFWEKAFKRESQTVLLDKRRYNIHTHTHRDLWRQMIEKALMIKLLLDIWKKYQKERFYFSI